MVSTFNQFTVLPVHRIECVWSIEMTPVCACLVVPAVFVPAQLTLTVNKGDTVNISMQLLSPQKRDVVWKYNGKLDFIWMCI